MQTYTIQTYGCQMNYSDTERMQAYLDALGFKKVDGFDKADIIMFNTCSIRQKAEDRVFGELQKMPQLRRKNPNLMVIVAGCMVRKSSSRYSTERDPLFGRMSDLDIALRTEELPRLASLAREIKPDLSIPEIKEEDFEDYFHVKATHDSHKSRAQAFVPISNGCDKFCTYCIVPYSRGREKSRALDDILLEANELVENGCKEIILIGQTVNSYGLSHYDKEHKTFDSCEQGEQPFPYLLKELDKLHEKGLQRVRFTSPHPKDMTDRLIDAMANLRTQMPYLHLPVQSGDDRTLKRMNRPYNIEKYRETVKRLRARIPDISISTDVIVGFCGESDDEFENTYEFFREMAFEHAYLAQYSERAGTTAARFIKDDIPSEVKNKRWHRLNNLLRKLSTDALKRFRGRTVNVLVEEQKNKTCLGRSEHFKTVQFKSGRKLLGKIVPVKITDSREWMLMGELE
ncbi:tRNA (N6-isopentenyl adenosine(37)-C2)-methylthiotransferase MiaB [Candidatus Peregrinibacteria bacterium]|nr:tRNA (N6-isopentenyl adenosine(37)-C2)-methylthiotransferase MiaB [Candidatus Peregrinibacteria bacterium]